MYVLTAENILYNEKNDYFLYNLKINESNEFIIRKAASNNQEHVFVHPILFDMAMGGLQALNSLPKSLKYICWSIALMILKFVHRIDDEILIKIHRQQIESSFENIIDLNQILVFENKYNINRKQISLLEQLMNISSEDDVQELNNLFLS